MSKKINIAIIGGGFSSEREISLKTSRQIAAVLPTDKYKVSFIDIDKKNNWLKKITKKIDVAFIALHGKFGEDGKIQAILDSFQIPYTGSGVLASALGMNKIKCLEFIKKRGINVPSSVVLRKREDIKNGLLNECIRKNIKYPCVVKPNESGSSVGIAIVGNPAELKKAVNKAFKEDAAVIIEEYIRGRELTCGVLGNTGKTSLLVLPLVEIIVHGSNFFDYKEKYFSKTVEEICPAKIDKKTTDEVKKIAKLIHEALGCDGLTRSDFILSEKNNKIYFLEINTIPGQTAASLCPKEASALGWTFQEFVEKQIKLALVK